MPDPDHPSPALRQAPGNLARGFCMGTADIIPGVSGGTMAFILGIYPRFLEAVRGFDARWIAMVLRGDVKGAARRCDLPLLVPLGIGILLAVVFFSRVVPLPQLIVSHPELVNGFFFGLIAASILHIFRQSGPLDAGGLVTLACGAAAGFAIVNLVPVETPDAAWFLFVSGAVGITAMLLPGVSGAFILLVLRKYATVIDAVGNLDFAVILPFALGIITGVVLFSRLIVWTLHHFHRRAMLAITGILIGSLWMIWPFQERVYETVRDKARLVGATPTWPQTLDATTLGAIALAIAGAALVLLLESRAGK